MFRKKRNNYFEMFVDLIEYSCKAAEYLIEILSDYDSNKTKEHLIEMHKIEHEADMKKHEMVNELVKEFITPIDVEDIINLAQEIDSVTDNIEDILIKMYMYSVEDLKPGVLEFCDIIKKLCYTLKDTLIEFQNFSKSEKIKDYIIVVNDLEEEGDSLYIRLMRDLFQSDASAEQKVIWRSIYRNFEACCDKAEDVANIVETIMMKNS